MTSPNTLHVVCGLVFHGNRVLAARRDPKRSFPLMWEFPGGKLENGESPETALHRELEEELRLKIRILAPLPPVELADNGRIIRLIPFRCTPAQAEAPTPLDHVEIRWVTANQARQLTWAPADIPLLEHLTES